ncbi:Maf family protein [Alkalilimnicola sp. S0819]|uniref:Maf family protein n=1 Tax=Alkalilimnicola sp. S0819 TaxID=2613922 RepID=UPI0012618E8F|nr:nucleoside triphosphate pyrophosphatase [Alkalilimnicola sp. S0819]KAB7627623.1 septum formation inhibitor Maf [Alkalilimnicola sp. S0819]MPQ15785.1 septum formation inhibitor Maf [Alkalilimnicola sp. S0819]
MTTPSRQLILGSSSPHRRALLERLSLAFQSDSPAVDETPLPDETPADYVSRLSLAKARAVATRHGDALIIGSDQAAILEGRILGKPGSAERAVEQLLAASGKTVKFLTGLCLLDSRSGEYQLDLVPYSVDFRELDKSTVERYVARESPLDCAGSFKSEGLGITLFRALRGEDPSALIGLPLIRLVDMLKGAGVRLP